MGMRESALWTGNYWNTTCCLLKPQVGWMLLKWYINCIWTEVSDIGEAEIRGSQPELVLPGACLRWFPTPNDHSWGCAICVNTCCRNLSSSPQTTCPHAPQTTCPRAPRRLCSWPLPGVPPRPGSTCCQQEPDVGPYAHYLKGLRGLSLDTTLRRPPCDVFWNSMLVARDNQPEGPCYTGNEETRFMWLNCNPEALCNTAH